MTGTTNPAQIKGKNIKYFNLAITYNNNTNGIYTENSSGTFMALPNLDFGLLNIFFIIKIKIKLKLSGVISNIQIKRTITKLN